MKKINLRGLQKYAVMFILIILMVLFSFSSPYFLTVRNLTNILTQNTYFIILAIGLSFVMIGGGIDLSVGWQMSLVGVVTAMCMTLYDLPVWLSIVAGLLLGTFLGFFNGMIVANIRVFPLIVTIATSTVFQGISYIVSHAQTYRQISFHCQGTIYWSTLRPSPDNCHCPYRHLHLRQDFLRLERAGDGWQ